MPSRYARYVNRSAEARARREREEQRRQASWDLMKAQVAAKYV